MSKIVIQFILVSNACSEHTKKDFYPPLTIEGKVGEFTFWGNYSHTERVHDYVWVRSDQ